MTDDETVANTGVNEELGTIQVELRRVERWESTEKAEPRRYKGDTELHRRTVHERSKKAGVHTVGCEPTSVLAREAQAYHQ